MNREVGTVPTRSVDTSTILSFPFLGAATIRVTTFAESTIQLRLLFGSVQYLISVDA